MTMPSVSCMCPTYGRVGLLEESIQSFLSQTYAGPTELVVVNDLPEQTLIWPDCPDNVRIINLPERCRNLGHKRNVVAEHCTGDLIMTWSDDDIHLPDRIHNNVAAYAPGLYVTEGRYVFVHGDNSKFVPHPMYGPFLMARTDFWDLGGIPDADNGEDLLFLARVQNHLRVVDAPETNYLYRWDTGRFHASHQDKKANAWQTYRDLVLETLRTGLEPSGLVTLNPHWKQDYVSLAARYLP